LPSLPGESSGATIYPITFYRKCGTDCCGESAIVVVRFIAKRKTKKGGTEVMNKTTHKMLFAAAILGLSITVGTGYALAARNDSACVNCHTDLKKMDHMGAEDAAGGGAIAG